MLCADFVTHIYQNKTSTMRGMPFHESLPVEYTKKIIRMQSSLQIGATLFMLGNIETAFVPLIAIQIAPFLMTLVRKNIIQSTMWHILYMITLWTSVGAYSTLNVSFTVIHYILYKIFLRLRFTYDYNKYLLWINIFGLYQFMKIVLAPIIDYYFIDYSTIFHIGVIMHFLIGQIYNSYLLFIL